MNDAPTKKPIFVFPEIRLPLKENHAGENGKAHKSALFPTPVSVFPEGAWGERGKTGANGEIDRSRNHFLEHPNQARA